MHDFDLWVPLGVETLAGLVTATRYAHLVVDPADGGESVRWTGNTGCGGGSYYAPLALLRRGAAMSLSEAQAEAQCDMAVAAALICRVRQMIKARAGVGQY